MARTQIPVTLMSRLGPNVGSGTPGDHANGMYFANNNGLVGVLIFSADASPKNVGFAIANRSIDGITVPDKVVTVPAGGTVYVGGFPTQWYSQDDLSVYINPDAGTLTFYAFQITES